MWYAVEPKGKFLEALERQRCGAHCRGAQRQESRGGGDDPPPRRRPWWHWPARVLLAAVLAYLAIGVVANALAGSWVDVIGLTLVAAWSVAIAEKAHVIELPR